MLSVIWIGFHLLDKFFDGDAQYLLKDELGDPTFAKHLQEDAAGYLKNSNIISCVRWLLKDKRQQDSAVQAWDCTFVRPYQ